MIVTGNPVIEVIRSTAELRCWPPPTRAHPRRRLLGCADGDPSPVHPYLTAAMAIALCILFGANRLRP
ncbi:MAG: hypothetical protein M3501_10890, partial [Actinomycetota bacterium]|nr:hypothetical protein [Actinomycetota bacterium]